VVGMPALSGMSLSDAGIRVWSRDNDWDLMGTPKGSNATIDRLRSGNIEITTCHTLTQTHADTEIRDPGRLPYKKLH
jgi:hypothetical protein